MNGPNGSYGASPYGGGYNPSYASTMDGAPMHRQSSGSPTQTLRRRNMDAASDSPTSPFLTARGGRSSDRVNGGMASPSVVKRLDFMFPKVDKEFLVKTDGGGFMSLIAYGLIAILVLAEVAAWASQNRMTKEHIFVDTSLGKRMRVNLNITFPGLACEDLHVDVMDVAGDSQLNIEDTMVKTRLSAKGRLLGDAPEKVESNKHKRSQEKKHKILKGEKPGPDYCGPCFGAQENEADCCNTCDELIEAYEKKRWRTDIILQTAEQCIREGRDRIEPKLMKKGEGCNIQGSMTLNRVAGNFHIAMGEGIEREGRHIHSFVPEDTPNFNASHIIHHLSFGSPDEEAIYDDQASLNGVSKIVSKEHGTTGLFQYFIKIVPTTMVTPGSSVKKETNRYFFTERFRPLISQLFQDDDDHVMDDDDRYLLGVSHDTPGSISESASESADSSIDEKLNNANTTEEEKEKLLIEKEKKWRERRERRIEKEQKAQKKARAAKAGHGKHHHNENHHHVRNAILPGVFFIYEIYPFAVEVSQNQVPLTHLLIRIMATVGGVFTVTRWVDSFFFSRGGNARRHSSVSLN